MKSTIDEQKIQAIEQAVGYEFSDKRLVLKAITHRSFAKEENDCARSFHNETLEFLGDAVLALASADILSKEHPHADEGELSHRRAAYVCQENLSQAAKRLDLGPHLRVSVSMRKSGPIDLPSVLSDTVEAILGAIYLDSGYEAAKLAVYRMVGDRPAAPKSQLKDPKTRLQEIYQGEHNETPEYVHLDTTGPEHAQIFRVEIRFDGNALGQGSGSNKKKAEQNAAAKVLAKLINEK